MSERVNNRREFGSTIGTMVVKSFRRTFCSERQNRNLDVLTQMEGWGVDLRRRLPASTWWICRHRIGRWRIARLDEKAGCSISRGDPAIDRAWHDQPRIGHALLDDHIDLGVGLAEDADSIARPPATHPRRSAGRKSPAPNPSARLPATHRVPETFQVAGGQIQHARRRDQVRSRPRAGPDCRS